MLNTVGSRAACYDEARDEQGFTLIELMVVVLIIGILLAIAIPTFLGARDRANDRSAQSNLRNALTAEKTLYTDNQVFTDSGGAAGVTALSQVEPSLTWVAAAGSYPSRNVSATGAAQTTVLADQSQTGTCFYIADTATGVAAATLYSESKATPCVQPAVPTTAAGLPAAGSKAGDGTWGYSF